MLDMRIASRIVLPQSAGPDSSTLLGALAITTGEGKPPGPLLWMVISINFNINKHFLQTSASASAEYKKTNGRTRHKRGFEEVMSFMRHPTFISPAHTCCEACWCLHWAIKAWTWNKKRKRMPGNDHPAAVSLQSRTEFNVQLASLSTSASASTSA